MRGQQYRRLLHSARSASRLRPADAITLDTEFHKRDVLALDGAPVQSTSDMESEHLANEPGAADKAANLGGCKSLCRQLPVNGRLAYPLLGEVTNRDMRGRRSHGCPRREPRGGSNLGGEQIGGPEDHRMTAAPRTQTLLELP